MRGRLWLRNFFDVVDLKWKETSDKKKEDLRSSDAEWTKFMGEVMDGIGKRMHCKVMRKREEKYLSNMTETEKKEAAEEFWKGSLERSGEKFTIDAVFVDDLAYRVHIGTIWTGGAKGEEYGPLALPAVVVELENDDDPYKICYDLWKVLSVRAPVRALVCYQTGEEKIASLRKQLEVVIWDGGLMKGTDGDLLVVIGDEDKNKKRAAWKRYFSAFEWKGDKLEKVEVS